MASVALGGLWLRARQGAVRERVLAALSVLDPVQLHPEMDDNALIGGIDLAATLASGRRVQCAGLLARDGMFQLDRAATATPGFAARLAQRIDAGGAALIALDECAAEGHALAGVLADRLGLCLSLDAIAWPQTRPLTLPLERITQARRALLRVGHGRRDVAALVGMARALGIDSLRAPSLALACARAACALRGGRVVDEVDLETACALVLAHRATRLPDLAADPALLRLPPDLRERISDASVPGAAAPRGANRRGRPLPSRAGSLGDNRRLDLFATLRTAAPWQHVRRKGAGTMRGGLIVHPGDLRLRRYRVRADRVVIFVLDASGSLATTRIAEARGAVELLLARTYARRDHAALIAFRDHGAEELLAPTRSLALSRRRLAGLPGGGPTPVAHGLRAAHDSARRVRARGMSPMIVLLSDGRANISLDGAASRRLAGADAKAMAQAIGRDRIETVIIDTGTMLSAQLGALGAAMGARVIALPRADAGRMAGALGAVLSGRG